ncbi:hypothetical protein VTO73DRAFT_11467 [Trametes versicolor]
MHLELPMTLRNHNISISTLQNLCHVLLKAFLVAWPLAYPGGVVAVKCWRAGDPFHLVARIRVWFSSLAGKRERPRYTTYSTPEQEDAYWRSAERTRRVFGASDANATPLGVPLVRYYVPRLPPAYRETKVLDAEATEYQLSPRAFCKWHRMVFRGPMHPTLKEAAKQLQYFSSRDRREIHRISRLVSDEEVFSGGARRWTPRYATMWKRWLETKGPDIAVVFE